MEQSTTPQTGQPSTPDPQPAPQPSKGSSGLGIAGLVLGIIALLISFVPIINNFAALLALVGLILSIISLVMIAKGKAQSKGISIAATVLNAVAIVVVLASQSLYSAAIDSALENTGYSSTASSSATTAQSSEAASASSASASSESTASTSNAKYEVSIDGCELATDYAGARSIIVTYTWTNNSSDSTSFMVAINAEAYQNGVELEPAIGTGVDSQALMNNVKPGATTTVQQAYVLADSSDVTVECTELISLNRNVIAEKTFPVA